MEILPDFQDAGDDGFLWIVLENEEKGRVDICPVDIDLKIKPRFSIKACQNKMIRRGVGG